MFYIPSPQQNRFEIINVISERHAIDTECHSRDFYFFDMENFYFSRIIAQYISFITSTLLNVAVYYL